MDLVLDDEHAAALALLEELEVEARRRAWTVRQEDAAWSDAVSGFDGRGFTSARAAAGARHLDPESILARDWRRLNGEGR